MPIGNWLAAWSSITFSLSSWSWRSSSSCLLLTSWSWTVKVLIVKTEVSFLLIICFFAIVNLRWSFLVLSFFLSHFWFVCHLLLYYRVFFHLLCFWFVFHLLLSCGAFFSISYFWFVWNLPFCSFPMFWFVSHLLLLPFHLLLCLCSGLFAAAMVNL